MRASPDFLKQQYQKPASLRARVELHARYSTNQYGWFPWVFDQFVLPEPATIVEVGCGTGQLWFANKERISKHWAITLTDFSQGMLTHAKQRLQSLEPAFDFAVAEATRLPFADQTVDVVIANHMLYHLQDPGAALQEFVRVLRPGGTLYCTTNGLQHLQELGVWQRLLHPDVATVPEHARFSLENGTAQLQRHFSSVRCLRYADALAVPDVEPVLNYLRSWHDPDAPGEERWETVRRHLQQELTNNATLHITKETGLFVARL